MSTKLARYNSDKIWLLYPLCLFGLPNSLRPQGLPIAPESLLLIFYLFAFIIRDIGFNAGKQLTYSLKSIPNVVYILFIFMSVSWIISSSDEKLQFCLHTLIWFMTFYFGFINGLKKDGISDLFLIWKALALFASLYFILTPSKWGEIAVNILAWEHRTGFGYFLVVPALYLMYKAIFYNKLDSVKNFIILIPIVIAILLTFSRGPWLLLYIGIFVLLLYRGRKKTAFIFVATSVIFASIFILTSEGEFALRLRSIYDFKIASSSFYRWDLFLSAIKAIPILGVFGGGPNSSLQIIRQFTLQDYSHMYNSTKLTTDSDIVWLLVETGPFTIALLITLLFRWAQDIIKSRHCSFEADNLVQHAILFTVFIGLIIFDNVLTSPLGWFIIGCGYGGSKRLINHFDRNARYS